LSIIFLAIMIKKLVFLPLIIFLLSFQVNAQQIALIGQVVDDSTKNPIPFVSVSFSGLNLGTSTNINGEFLIYLDSLPVNLIFSHVSFNKKEVTINNNDYFSISLKPRKILLDELIINDEESGDYPYLLMTRALNNARNKSRNWKYGLAFYRQTSKNADDFSELYEIFYDTRYSSQGIVDWEIQEGRYAMKSGGSVNHYVFNRNFTLLTSLVTMFQPETDKYVMPVNENVKDYFDLKILELIDVEGRKVAIVHFTPKEEIYIPAMEGDIFIDIDNLDIIKLKAKIENDQFDLISLTNPKGTWNNFSLEIEAAYNSTEEEMLLDYISLHQTFDYLIDGQFSHKVETNSFLTYYEYYQPEKFKRLGGRLMRLRKSDRELLDQVGYNKRFWEENPIVLRTPVEDEIIASFEAANAFGTIYLNDRQQIQLDKDELKNDPFIQQLSIDLMKSKIASQGEKVYLHFNKPYYASGEAMWFNAYTVNLSSLILSDNSGVLYVDLISPSGEIIVNQKLRILNGLSDGMIDIPKSLSTGQYQVRAYTNWMRNYDDTFFFNKHFYIYNSDEVLNDSYPKQSSLKDFDVQFFPEGGQLIQGLTAQIAFKAIDDKGKGIEINGSIVDSNGKKITEFKTRHDGMGSFFFHPQIGTEYKLKFSYKKIDKSYDFPEIIPEGYAITVNNLKDKNIQVMIKNTPSLNNTELIIVAQTRGILFHREKIEVKRGGAVVSIPKAKFPDGIVQITIFNMDKLPICERLVFIDNQQIINTTIQTDKMVLNKRDKVTLRLFVNDQYGKAVRNTNFSMAITDAAHIMKNNTRETIKSNLLLSSDLKGKISNPGYYFLEDTRDSRIAMDLVMLTHGWRRFTWQEISNGSLIETTFSHESGINISGTSINRSGKPVTNAFINFISMNKDYPGIWETTTDNNGKFTLNGLIIPDSLNVIAKILNDKGKVQSTDLILEQVENLSAKPSGNKQIPPIINDDIIQYLKLYNERDLFAATYDVNDKVLLENVIVESERLTETYHGEADNVITVDESMMNYPDVFQLLQGRVPGLSVTGQGMTSSISLRGGGGSSGDNTPLFIIDGMVVSTLTAPVDADRDTISVMTSVMSTSNPNASYINSILMSIQPRDIERIEVLKGSSAGIYGVRGANGVISIYTRKGPSLYDDSDPSMSGDLIYLPGFNIGKEFYVPKYEIKNDDYLKPDKRTTIYWDPSVRTNNFGYADITFYNSDEGKKLQVEIEGVTDDGDPVNMTTILGGEEIQ